jgi:hypothetical protein
LGIAFKAAVGAHEAVQGALTGVTEGRMAQVVGETGALDEIRVDEAFMVERGTAFLQPGADGAADLRHLDGVGQAGAVEIVLARHEDLGLALQAAKGRAVDDPVAIHLKRAAVLTCGRDSSVEIFEVEGVVKTVGQGHDGRWKASQSLRQGEEAASSQFGGGGVEVLSIHFQTSGYRRAVMGRGEAEE